MNIFSPTKRKRQENSGLRNAGFGLVELLVALALFGMIAAGVIISYRKISGQLFVTGVAYEVALSFREAQSYGVSVREFREEGSGDFDIGYGLHFDAGTDMLYALFADIGGIGGDNRFQGTFGSAYNDTGCFDNSAECIKVFRLERGVKIYKFCGVLSGDAGRDAPDSQKREDCNINPLPATNRVISYLDVTFLRPNPDALIQTSESAHGRQYKAARIYVVSPVGEKRVIEVVSTGQISVK